MSGPFTTPVAESTPFESTVLIPEDNVQAAIEYTYDNAPGNVARFTITLLNNGTVSNGTFMGYSELIPGDATPIVLPRDCLFTEFTFSNNKTKADYTLLFKKNATGATPFYSISKVNTQFFFDTTPNESFLAGDQIYVQYQDDGQNARDVALVLFFRNV